MKIVFATICIAMSATGLNLQPHNVACQENLNKLSSEHNYYNLLVLLNVFCNVKSTKHNS